MVVSVGPYRFSTIELGAASCHAAAYDADKGSPQKRLQRSEGKQFADNNRIRESKPMTEGTENHIVSPLSRMNFAGAITDFSGTTNRQAPRSQQTNMSCTLKSNVRSNSCESRSSQDTSYRSQIYSTYDRTFAWWIGTPFGTPVLPDVNNRYATACGSTSTECGKSTALGMSSANTNRCCGRSDASLLSVVVSGRITVIGRSWSVKSCGSCETPSFPAMSVAHFDRRSIERVRSTGNFGLSGTYPFRAPRIPRSPAYAVTLRHASRAARGC